MTDTNDAGDVGPVEVDFADLTLAELDELDNALGERGAPPLAELLGARGQFRAMAGAAWILRRRIDPSYTFDDALRLRMRDLKVVGDPETLAGVGGVTAPTSAASGESLPRTST